jgi:hypothetical protein
MRERNELVWFICGVLGGCAAGQSGASIAPQSTEREIGTAIEMVEVEEGARIESFSAAVPAQEEGGECEVLPLGITAPDEKVVTIAFPDRINAERKVALTFDRSGQLLHYNDLRGDLRHGDATGPRTSIILDFEQDTGLAINDSPERPGQAAFGTATEFLAEASVGEPQRMIEVVKERCGAG